jgi:hypothetical protein
MLHAISSKQCKSNNRQIQSELVLRATLALLTATLTGMQGKCTLPALMPIHEGVEQNSQSIFILLSSYDFNNSIICWKATYLKICCKQKQVLMFKT